jgi:hypothetical protein
VWLKRTVHSTGERPCRRRRHPHPEAAASDAKAQPAGRSGSSKIPATVVLGSRARTCRRAPLAAARKKGAGEGGLG